MPTRSMLTALLAVAIVATPTLAQEETPPGVPTGSPSAGPSLEPVDPLVDDGAGTDLWIGSGITITRVDGEDGTILERLDVGGTGCLPHNLLPTPLRPDHGALWWPGVASTEPGAAECVVKVPLDGSDPVAISAEPGRPLSVRGARVLGWDSLLARTSENVAKRVDSTFELFDVDVAEAGGVIIGMFKFWRLKRNGTFRLGLIDPGSGRLWTPSWLKARTKADRLSYSPRMGVALSTGPGGLVLARDAVRAQLIDPAAETRTSVAFPKGSADVYEAIPTPAGTWFYGSMKGGAAYVAVVPTGRTRASQVDVCAGRPKGCFPFLMTWTDDAVWVLVGRLSRSSGGLGFEHSVLRRYRFGETESSLDVPLARALPRDWADR